MLVHHPLPCIVKPSAVENTQCKQSIERLHCEATGMGAAQRAGSSCGSMACVLLSHCMRTTRYCQHHVCVSTHGLHMQPQQTPTEHDHRSAANCRASFADAPRSHHPASKQRWLDCPMLSAEHVHMHAPWTPSASTKVNKEAEHWQFPPSACNAVQPRRGLLPQHTQHTRLLPALLDHREQTTLAG